MKDEMEDVKSSEVTMEDLVEEWVEDGPLSDMGIPYPIFIRIYRKYDMIYLDEILDAPWQVGGNSGQVRSLRRITEEEYKLLRER